MSERAEWDAYFLHLAAFVATRSTCPRAAVGCVLVVDRRIVAAGYNGAIAGAPHCTDAGCDIRAGHCVRAVHSEANAIADAARRGVAVQGARAYITHAPCHACAKLLLSAGVQRIVYSAPYSDGANMQFLASTGIDVQQMEAAE